MEGKDGEVLTEHETPNDFWLGKTVEGTRPFAPNLTTHEICIHLLERIENIEKRLIPQNVLSVFLVIIGILIYIK